MASSGFLRYQREYVELRLTYSEWSDGGKPARGGSGPAQLLALCDLFLSDREMRRWVTRVRDYFATGSPVDEFGEAALEAAFSFLGKRFFVRDMIESRFGMFFIEAMVCRL